MKKNFKRRDFIKKAGVAAAAATAVSSSSSVALEAFLDILTWATTVLSGCKIVNLS